MADESHLDKKYFINHDTYNCPFCHRGSVGFKICGSGVFDWTNSKVCWFYNITCNSCSKTSMHFSFEQVDDKRPPIYFLKGIDLDGCFFYHVPSSFFVIDDRIPAKIRQLISEAEDCLKMNFLTGASRSPF